LYLKYFLKCLFVCVHFTCISLSVKMSVFHIYVIVHGMLSNTQE